MFVPAAYVIAPRERLIEALKSVDADFADCIDELTVVWRERERFEMTHLRDCDRVRTLHVQALFLLNFRESYFTGQNDASVSQALRDLLGFPDVDVRVFDNWWTIRRADDRLFFERAAKKFDASTLAAVRNGDEPIPALVQAFATTEDA